ncbi:MAG: D-alanine--D-alanine ligase [Lachnospiraceae bacterium]|nr:D-alanine--D-alanine ligase [Lachnospiraceae bacterium]
MSKKNLVALFGGQSSEHVVSCMSVQNVVANIDRDAYNVILVGITEDGHWLKVDSTEEIKNDTWRESKVSAVLSPDATEKCLLVMEEGRVEKVPVDVVFPVLHGLYGEDGTVQGILELARIPYVGCGVLASAVSMDKLSTKIIVNSLGIRQAAFVAIFKEEMGDMDAMVARVEEAFPYPVFVKPSNAGSSRGVSRADSREELIAGLEEAARHDRRILVEEMIVGHEVECAVYGGGLEAVKASGVGEILAAAEFYDFDAKYNNAESKTVVIAELPGNATEIVRDAAIKIFKAVDGYGLSRVDFFVEEDGGVVFNEINTLPGFTAISMYPMLWEERGISKPELVDALISHACKRYER